MNAEDVTQTKPDCYVAKKQCGCFVACIVNNPERRKEVAKQVAQWLRLGFQIAPATIEEARNVAKWALGGKGKCQHEGVPS